MIVRWCATGQFYHNYIAVLSYIYLYTVTSECMQGRPLGVCAFLWNVEDQDVYKSSVCISAS